VIGQTISHYRILSKIGEGGMGTVYVAEDILLERQVAVKSLKVPSTPAQKHFRTRFLREARAASRLNHPHIATIYDYGETDDGQPYLVMELIEGHSLNDILSRDTLSPDRAITIIKQVAEAIAEAHHHGIVHRDIKPSNVALNQRNEVKVLDFGLAKQIEPSGLETQRFGETPELTATKTLEGVVIGTPAYLSPEQALGVPVDKRSDIFSIGSLLYECLTGKPAFSGKSLGEIFAQVIRDDPVRPSQVNPRVSAELDRITLKALAKKTEARYQTVDALLEDLRGVDATLEEGPAISRSTRKYSFPRLSLKHWTVLLGVALLITLLALLLATRRRAGAEPSAQAMQIYQAGTAALRNGNYIKAGDLFEQAIKTDAQFPLAHARLAEVWSDLDYEEKATNEMLRVTELAPNLSSLPPLDMLYVQAIGATVRRNYQGAVENLEEVVKRSSEAEKGSAYFDLGRAYERVRDTNHAIGAFEEVTRRDSQAAAAFLRLGGLYGRKQEEAKSAEAFAKAQTLYDGQNNSEGTAEVFYQRGALLSVNDKLPEAQEQFKRALDLARTTGNKPQQIKSLLQLGSIFYSTGDTNRAEQYTTQAMQLAAAEQLDNLTTTGLVEIGNAFLLRGEYGEAEKQYQQALQIAKANKGRRAEARASIQLGSLFVTQGNGSAAVKYLEPALAFYRQGNFRRETLQALLLLGYANEQQGNNEEAFASFKEQLELAQQVNDTAQVAHTHAAIGLLLLHQERFTEALSHFDESYKLNKLLGLEPKTGLDLVNRGNLLWQLGHYKEALEALDQAFDIASRAGGVDKQLLGWIHLFRARIALSEFHYGEAIAQSRNASALGGAQDKDFSVQVAYTLGLAQVNSGTSRAGVIECQKAIDIATRAGDPRLISNAQLALAEALLSTGDAANGLTSALQAQKTFARLGNRHSEWRAWLIAAQASRQERDGAKVDEYSAHSSEMLKSLERTLGANEYASYLSRPDVQRYRKQLDELLPGANN
jgi:tetratricopeptide (TPR) repeat protein/tRNA A-37 threonylcarbamoyl transferase component Bud32